MPPVLSSPARQAADSSCNRRCCFQGCPHQLCAPAPRLDYRRRPRHPRHPTPPARPPAYLTCPPARPAGLSRLLSPPQGVCTLHYKGPLPIGYGLRAAVRDKFPDIIEVLMIDPDTQEPLKFEAV